MKCVILNYQDPYETGLNKGRKNSIKKILMKQGNISLNM